MFIDWKARAIVTQADVDIEPEEELYASLIHEASFTLPLPGIPSLKELCLGKLKMVTTYVSLQLRVQNRRKKWNFPLNFRTMRKLSDLYSGIFQNY